MKKNPEYENFIQKPENEDKISYKFKYAYQRALDYELDRLDIEMYLDEEEAEAFVSECLLFGYRAFTVSSEWSNCPATLLNLQEAGARIIEVIEIVETNQWGTENKKPAILMSIVE